VRFLLEEHQRPLRRSCDMVGLSRAAWYRPPLDWTVRDAEIISALAELVKDRPARGFWKCRKLLRRRRPEWNHKRIYRVYKAMGLNRRRAAKRRLPKRERVPLYVPRTPDSVWPADFMSDALVCGRRFRTFNVEDDFNREALHIEVDTSISSLRLVRIFQRLQRERGLPQVLRTDNGPEFLGEAFTEWAKEQGMAIQYIQPGQPNQNAYIERFNRTFREEVLDQYLFRRLEDVREAAWWWMLEYNEQRSHDSLGDLTPAEVRQQYEESSTYALCA
jgi:putative transposase